MPSAVMPLFYIMLAQEILAVVVAVGRANNDVYVLARWLFRVHGEATQVCRQLMIELDKNYGAMDPVVEDAIRIGPPIHAK